MADSLAHRLEVQIPGFKAVFGGEELKRASAALGGALGASQHGGSAAGEEQPASSPPLRARPSGPYPHSPPAAVAALLARQSVAVADASEADLMLRELALAANQYSRMEAEARGAAAEQAEAEAEAGAGEAAGEAGPSGRGGGGGGAPYGNGGGMPYDEYETVYHHGLVLQELAGKLAAGGAGGGGPGEQLELLQQACELYAAATAQRPSSHAALYNWGVALSDMARLLREADPGRALACLEQASHRYASALDLQPGNPQALNNWGLVLQEMSGHAHSAAERDALVSYALEKFRHALRLRPDFDRGCYNMGTVLYTTAAAVQADLATQLKAGRLTSPDAETSRERHAREARVRGLFTAAAQYICLAAALQPGRDIYRRSLAVVRPMLPLPFLRAGYLTAPARRTLGSAAEAWRREWVVLDQDSLRSASAEESSLSSAGAGAGLGVSAPTLKIGHAVGESPLVVPLESILSVRRCFDPSLPEGEALWLHLAHPLAPHDPARHPHAPHPAATYPEPWPAAATAAAARHPAAAVPAAAAPPPPPYASLSPYAPPCSACSVWLVADDADAADAWVDALLLARYVVHSRSARVLAEALTPPPPLAGAAAAGEGAGSGRVLRVSGGGGG